MSIRSKKQTVDNIIPRTVVIRGAKILQYVAYAGTCRGKPVRFTSTDRDDVLRRVNEFYENYKELGDCATVLSPSQIYDSEEAYKILSKAHVSSSLGALARRYVEDLSRKGLASASGITILDAYKQFVSRIDRKVQYKQFASVENRVGGWMASLDSSRNLTTVSAKDVEEYIKRFENPKTYNNNLTYINTFLNWCAAKERGFIVENPAKGITCRRIAWKEPKYMMSDDVEKLVRAVEKKGNMRLLAVFVLSFFCGMRTEEIMRLACEDEGGNINLDDNIVRVSMPKGYQKGTAPRAFPMQPNALAWFRAYGLDKAFFLKDGEHVAAGCINRTIPRIAKAEGIVFPHNAGRHTFITMHVAAYGEPQKTEYLCGTSAAMRARNYMGLAPRKEGERYFQIMPLTASPAPSVVTA